MIDNYKQLTTWFVTFKYLDIWYTGIHLYLCLEAGLTAITNGNKAKPNKTETKQQEEDCKNVEATTICLGFLIKATGFLPISKICYV